MPSAGACPASAAAKPGSRKPARFLSAETRNSDLDVITATKTQTLLPRACASTLAGEVPIAGRPPAAVASERRRGPTKNLCPCGLSGRMGMKWTEPYSPLVLDLMGLQVQVGVVYPGPRSRSGTTP